MDEETVTEKIAAPAAAQEAGMLCRGCQGPPREFSFVSQLSNFAAGDDIAAASKEPIPLALEGERVPTAATK